MLRVVAAQRDVLLRAYLEQHEAACPTCGYSLRGCVTEVCPECGAGLALALAPRRVDRRTLLLLAMMLAWVLIASAIETYAAQRGVRAQAQAWSQFGTVTIVAVEAANPISPSGPITFQPQSVAITAGPPARAPAATPSWSAVPWMSWVRLGGSGLMSLLALAVLVALVLSRDRAQGTPVLVRCAATVFIVWCALAIMFRVV